jgi:ATP-dependent DNA ligase
MVSERLTMTRLKIPAPANEPECNGTILALSAVLPASSSPPDDNPHGADRAGVGFEIKHDGYRFICRSDGDCLRRVFSRRGIDHSSKLRRGVRN